MSHRIAQINSLLQSEIAVFLSREVYSDDYLATITYVNCSPDLKQAKIGVSVLPEKFLGTALKTIRKHSSHLNKYLKKKLNLKFIPKLIWQADDREIAAASLDDIIKKIHEEDG